MVHHLLGFAAGGFAVSYELDAEQETDSAHISHQRMAGLDRLHALERALTEPARAIEEAFLIDDIEGGERCSTAHRAFFVGVMAEGAIRGNV